ncbi:hypothetical protein [Nannocystis sp.]|uniref:hypothetical protein n=1 Tax=Nannocystis sp. TaxID=1962667 RepID=UPI0024209E14|nr:hypothetical protein [Nannocystis sp.]MBK7824889.1 hypothetical protein [Nannocystis sp.]MBK9752857.1 hypothetical protein [Nannocystis sp.]
MLDTLTPPVDPVAAVSVCAPVSVAEAVPVALVVTSPLLCVCPCEAVPVVGGSPVVVGAVALAPVLAVASVALAGPTPVPVSPVDPPVSSPHPDIHPINAMLKTPDTSPNRDEVRIPGADHAPSPLTSPREAARSVRPNSS